MSQPCNHGHDDCVQDVGHIVFKASVLGAVVGFAFAAICATVGWWLASVAS